MIVHSYPVGDLMEHDLEGDDCVCGPDAIPVEREDGSYGWVIGHHSLDGREKHEEPHAMDCDLDEDCSCRWAEQ